MPLDSSPADRLHQQTLEAIGNLTDYRIGHMWAAENDGKPKLLMARSREWRLKQPKTLADFAELMDAIGYQVTIEPKSGLIESETGGETQPGRAVPKSCLNMLHLSSIVCMIVERKQRRF